jgi:uncharacterized protein with ACT and thioredoxin-like domain
MLSKEYKMLTLAKKFIVNDKNKKIAVQIPIDTYNRIEEVLEDFALGQYILEVKDEKTLTAAEARKFYGKRTRA